MTSPSFQLLIQAVITVLAGLAFAKLVRYVRDRYVQIDPDEWFENLINQIPNDEETETNILF